MKTIAKFNAGAAFAMTEIHLVIYDVSNPADVARAKKKFERKTCRSPFFHYRAWESARARKPLYVVIPKPNSIEDAMHRILRSLPHEICHLIGYISEQFNIKSEEEPAAYLCGYLMENFQRALLKEAGLVINRKSSDK